MKNDSLLFAMRMRRMLITGLLTVLMSGWIMPVMAVNDTEYSELSGKIVDKKTGEALPHATVCITGTKIAVVANSDGRFVLKLPAGLEHPTMMVSYIGYKIKKMDVEVLKNESKPIEMESAAVQLPVLSVTSRDATELIRTMLARKGKNYSDTTSLMTAFYRESIRKGRSYVSLAEAVAEVNKQPYTSGRSDVVRLFKSRKKADYSRLDTLNFKLMGGPFNSLYLDVMKYTDVLLTDDIFANYEFSFDHSTYVGKQPVFVVNFKQRSEKTQPLYYGKLYIDGETMALRSAVFSLNLTNRDEAANMFIMRKPLNAHAYPVEANYRIDYREDNGKWVYSYSRIELGIRIAWKRRLFNTTYYSTLEMAVTDFGHSAEKKSFSYRDRLKPSVIIQDEASGFADPAFWGEFNVIEPEKPIEAAIKKIRNQLEKTE